MLSENESSTWHVIHDHVKVFCVLKGKVQLDDPLGVGMGHDISFFPEESRIWSLDLIKYNNNNYIDLHILHFVSSTYHFKLAEQFHGIDFLCWLVPH